MDNAPPTIFIGFGSDRGMASLNYRLRNSYLVCSRLSGARLRRFERIKAAKEQAAKPIEKVAEELNELLKAEEHTTAMLTGEASKSPRRGHKHVSP